MLNVAAVEPAPSVTDGGTMAAAMFDDSATLAPPAGAPAVSVTVPVDAAPPVTDDGLALTALNAAVGGGVAGFQPSWITSKSLAVSAANAGFSALLFQRTSKVPEMYMSLPLSATISPYFCIARKILRRFGSDVRSAGSEPLTSAFSRSRAPIGSAPDVEPARCDAGYT